MDMKKIAFIILAVITAFSFFACNTASDDATLNSLKVYNGATELSLTPEFTTTEENYTLSVSNSVNSLTVKPIPNNNFVNNITVNGETVVVGSESPPVELAEGAVTDINVVVTAQDMTTTKTYTISVTRAKNLTLSNLTTTPTATWVPEFDPNVNDYKIDVTNADNQITFTPTVEDTSITIHITGGSVDEDVDSGSESSAIDLAVLPDTNEVTITVTDGLTENVYNITVDRPTSADGDPTLANLTSDKGAEVVWDKAFDTAVYEYNLNVLNTVSEIRFTPTATDPALVDNIKINGTEITSGAMSNAISLTADGTTTVEIIVTANNLLTRNYTLNIHAVDVRNTIELVTLASFDPFEITDNYLSTTLAQDTIDRYYFTAEAGRNYKVEINDAGTFLPNDDTEPQTAEVKCRVVDTVNDVVLSYTNSPTDDGNGFVSMDDGADNNSLIEFVGITGEIELQIMYDESYGTYDAYLYEYLEAPANLTATEGEADHILVDWDDVSGANQYRLYRVKMDQQGEEEEIAIITDSQYDDTDATLEEGFYYRYWVYALNTTRNPIPGSSEEVDGYIGAEPPKWRYFDGMDPATSTLDGSYYFTGMVSGNERKSSITKDDSTGNIYIAYLAKADTQANGFDDKAIKIAVYNGTTWDDTTYADIVLETDAAYDMDGLYNPQVSYINSVLYLAYDEYSDGQHTIYVKSWNGTAWVDAINGNLGDAFITSDDEDYDFYGFYDGTDTQLYVAYELADAGNGNDQIGLSTGIVGIDDWGTFSWSDDYTGSTVKSHSPKVLPLYDSGESRYDPVVFFYHQSDEEPDRERTVKQIRFNTSTSQFLLAVAIPPDLINVPVSGYLNSNKYDVAVDSTYSKYALAYMDSLPENDPQTGMVIYESSTIGTYGPDTWSRLSDDPDTDNPVLIEFAQLTSIDVEYSENDNLYLSFITNFAFNDYGINLESCAFMYKWDATNYWNQVGLELLGQVNETTEDQYGKDIGNVESQNMMFLDDGGTDVPHLFFLKNDPDAISFKEGQPTLRVYE